MALAASPLDERKRVKVYELQETDWHDRGTGFCHINSILDDARILVEAEEDPQSPPLLDIKVQSNDNFQKQQDTLIVWTDPNGVDMALSFQEADGCSSVWEILKEVKAKVEGHVRPMPPLLEPSLGNLDAFEQSIKELIHEPRTREWLVKTVILGNYVGKLTPLVEEAEDFESLDDLHRLCNIMKQLILLNDNSIIDQVVQEDVFEGVIGALEYDPDFPEHKANHRQFFREMAKFKEVVEISDPEIRKKIHYTYRLQYLKDVALARILDDPSFTMFNSLIYFHHIDIVQFVASSPTFLASLFTIINAHDRPLQERKDAIAFIQQSCQIAKTLAAQPRNELYSNLLRSGLSEAINFALQNKDSAIRIAGTDVLVAIIDHDMMMMRNTVHKAANEEMSPITDTLIDLFLVETDLGVKAQVADAIKVLLDSNPNLPDAMGSIENAFHTARFRNLPFQQSNRFFLDHHLQRSMHKLFQPLVNLEKRPSINDFSMDESSLFCHLVEILSFFVRQPSPSPKKFILEQQLIPRTARLLDSTDKQLKLAAIKFCKTCILAIDNEEVYHRALKSSNIFTRLLDMASVQRDNLINSTLLSIYEQIREEYQRPIGGGLQRHRNLILYLGETYREKLESLTYSPVFAAIARACDRLKNPGRQPTQSDGDIDSSFLTSDAGSPHMIVNGMSTRWSLGLHEDRDEESYFSSQLPEDDDDELGQPHTHLSNGVHASPLGKPLVDYGEDDDEEETLLNGAFIADTPPGIRHADLLEGHDSSSPTPAPAPHESSPADVEMSSDTTAPNSTPPRPISVAEKRRREEDEEDELGKLMGSGAKRRNSGNSISSKANSTADWSLVNGEEHDENAKQSPEPEKDTEAPKIQMLRRRPRQSFNGGSGPVPKMAIKIGSNAAPDKGKR